MGTVAVPTHEVAPEYSQRQMARPSAASDSCPHPDGDVARCAHLRSALAMADRRQRDCAAFLLRDRFWTDRYAARRPDWIDRLERNQKGKTGVEDRFVPHDSQSDCHAPVRGESRFAIANVS